MFLAGLIMSITLVVGGFSIAEILFYLLNGRFFWRAFIPAALRFSIFPDDKIELDCYDVLTEYTSLMLYCSGLVLPFIALNYMGFVHFF
ncbi:MAG: hypothetical protein II961_03895 [Candidatus Riflebacteria bacterium]|jgi:hypothetical protein|nr:hypothetical protein [Candidatus Riflebacteria bacterium]